MKLHEAIKILNHNGYIITEGTMKKLVATVSTNVFPAKHGIPENYMINIEINTRMSDKQKALFEEVCRSHCDLLLDYIDTDPEDDNTLYEVYPINDDIDKHDINIRTLQRDLNYIMDRWFNHNN